MAEPIAATGAAVFNFSGQQIGTVTRATDKSLWIGGSRYTPNSSGSFKRHGSVYAESFYADGTAAWATRQREIAADAENAAADEAVSAMRERIKDRISEMTSRKRAEHKWAETQAERLVRVEAIEAAVMAALEVSDG